METDSILRECGLRCTRQRAIVYEALRGTKSHPTAEELLAMVRPSEAGISLATVYNTLDALCERGLVRRLVSGDGGGACRFDATVEEHAHVTLADGRVVDVPREIDERLRRGIDEGALQALAQTLGVEVERLEVRVTARVRD